MGLAELEHQTGKRQKKRVKQIKRDKRRTHKQASTADTAKRQQCNTGALRGWLSLQKLLYQDTPSWVSFVTIFLPAESVFRID